MAVLKDGNDQGPNSDSTDFAESNFAIVDSSSTGWISAQPIIVGRPITTFEPKSVDSSLYRATPYRADASLDGWSTGFCSVRAASLRGYAHRFDRTPRQDDFALLLSERGNRLIVAVADGVSAAKQSHIGATTAVRYATQWLASVDLEADLDWKGLIDSTAWALIEQAALILGEPKIEPTEAEKILATTLVSATIDPLAGGALSATIAVVGDSGAIILSRNGFKRISGGKEEGVGGISSSSVAGLPRVPLSVDVVSVTVEPGEVLLLATDGFLDPLGGGTGEVGQLFSSTLLDRLPSILEFGHVLDFSRETWDDDRTLVAIWPKGPSGNS